MKKLLLFTLLFLSLHLKSQDKNIYVLLDYNPYFKIQKFSNKSFLATIFYKEKITDNELLPTTNYYLFYSNSNPIFIKNINNIKKQSILDFRKNKNLINSIANQSNKNKTYLIEKLKSGYYLWEVHLLREE